MIAGDDSLGEEDQAAFKRVLPHIAARIDVLQRAHQTAWQRAASQLFGERSWIRKPAVLAFLAAGLLVMALPMPYQVACRCTVQPVKRRFVTAPYEGRLEGALVKPGDGVRQGQTVAVMDGSEIRYNLAALRADYDRVLKERQKFLANQQIAAAQIAALQMERFKQEITLLERREKNLEIKSPIDGLVVSGDPQKIEGARMGKGDKLIEVAPTEQMLIELEIPDDEILHVQPGNQVRFRLHADPLTVHRSTLRLLHPRSEQIDSRNVFIGEVPFANSDGTLRPGMNGKAYVIGARRPLGWNLFHRPWNQLVFRLGW